MMIIHFFYLKMKFTDISRPFEFSLIRLIFSRRTFKNRGLKVIVYVLLF